MTHTTTSAINTQIRTVDGLSIRYAESAPGRDRDALVTVSRFPMSHVDRLGAGASGGLKELIVSAPEPLSSGLA